MSAEERHGDLVKDGSLLDWFRTMVAEAASRGENAYRLLSERALGDMAPEMQGLYEEAHRTLRRGEALLPATVWALLERAVVLFDERMPPLGLEAFLTSSNELAQGEWYGLRAWGALVEVRWAGTAELGAVPFQRRLLRALVRAEELLTLAEKEAKYGDEGDEDAREAA